jgi:hypothetical protein
MQTGSCCNHCPTPETIEIPGPQGDAGTNGTDGTNGVNAFTITTEDFVVPAIGNTVTIDVADSSWMVVWQNLFIGEAGYFEVATIPSSTTVEIRYLDYEFNLYAGDSIPTGTGVSPGGTQPTAPTIPEIEPIAAYASGTAYTITTVDSAVTFGTSQPLVTITTAGTWRLTGRLKLSYSGATFAAVRNVTLKLRRTNNTASDVANSSSTFQTEIITTLTYTADVIVLPDVTYVTANNDDQITIFAVIDTGPTAGAITVSEANIYAEFIHD